MVSIRPMQKKFMAILMLSMPGIGFCAERIECDDATSIVVEYYRLSEKQELDRNDMVSRDCKISPTQTDDLLFAAVHDLPGDKLSSTKKSIIAIIDTRSKQVVASHHGTIHHDGTICAPTYRISLDTAAYQLTPELRAVGYRIKNSGSCPKCTEENDKLSLFVMEGKGLRPVLENLAMQTDRIVGKCSGFEKSKDSYMEVAFLTLGVEREQSHGYADLLLKTTIGFATSTNDGREFPDMKPAYFRLRYDGKQYRPRAKHHPWWVRTGAQ